MGIGQKRSTGCLLLDGCEHHGVTMTNATQWGEILHFTTADQQTRTMSSVGNNE
jgi:hypothetical protein